MHAFARYFLIHLFMSLCTHLFIRSFNMHAPFVGKHYELASLVQRDLTPVHPAQQSPWGLLSTLCVTV